mmetsp:Transcript_33536/g.51551  ORF Transcript_33536/g.51551 Transcript_33536/m.51551 type:complete len:132 (-) Transcript_33536:376-771(-)
MMQAEKIFRSSTKHYRITLASDTQKFIPTDKLHIGRVRSNLAGTYFSIYDDGLNPKDATEAKLNEGEVLRRKYGCIHYSDKDKEGRKVERNMDVYIPDIDQEGVSVYTWPDGEKRRNNIQFEYEQQQNKES